MLDPTYRNGWFFMPHCGYFSLHVYRLRVVQTLKSIQKVWQLCPKGVFKQPKIYDRCSNAPDSDPIHPGRGCDTGRCKVPFGVTALANTLQTNRIAENELCLCCSDDSELFPLLLVGICRQVNELQHEGKAH